MKYRALGVFLSVLARFHPTKESGAYLRALAREIDALDRPRAGPGQGQARRPSAASR